MIYIVRGLLYGDEGKGSIVDYISQNCSDVIKEGGPQAAHHIVSRDGKLHRSEQMGSGIFNNNVRTFSSKNALISIENLVRENIMLQQARIYDGMKRLFIDSRCPVVTPLHSMIGRMQEISKGENRHGSTGMGVGNAVKDWKEKGNEVLTVGDISNESILIEKLDVLFMEKFEEAYLLIEDNPYNETLYEMYENYWKSVLPKLIFNSYTNFAITYPSCIIHNGENHLQELLESDNNLVFEGSQGALLDPEFGFLPYVTKTRTTFDTAMELIRNKVSKSDITRLGVVRAYGTRHGQGPFVTEDDRLTTIIPDVHNTMNVWQGKFRIGWLDLVAVRYGIEVNKGINSVALTNLDRLSKLNNIFVCTNYEYCGHNESDLEKFFEYEHSRNRTIITRFKNPVNSTNERITKILFDCKPIYKKFTGWKTGINNVKDVRELPKEAIQYISFLQSEEGLNEKISIISVGETSENKIMIEDNMEK